MKIILSIGLVSTLLLLAANRPTNEANATVEKRMGVDVYVMSSPTQNFEVLDSGSSQAWLSCNEIINRAIKHASKDGADGVIIYFESKRYDEIKYIE